MTFVNRDRKICETFICAFLADTNSKNKIVHKFRNLKLCKTDKVMKKWRRC